MERGYFGANHADDEPAGPIPTRSTRGVDYTAGSVIIKTEWPQSSLAADPIVSAVVKEETYILPHSSEPEDPDRVQLDCKGTVKSETCILPDTSVCDDGEQSEQKATVGSSVMSPCVRPLRSTVGSCVSESGPTRLAETASSPTGHSDDSSNWEPSSGNNEDSDEEWRPGGAARGNTSRRKGRAPNEKGKNGNENSDRRNFVRQERQEGYVRFAGTSSGQRSTSSDKLVAGMAPRAQGSSQVSEEKLMCCECPMLLNTAQALGQHQTEMHPETDPANCRCPLCKEMVSVADLQQHLMCKAHYNMNSIRRICLHCETPFNDSDRLTGHMRVVHQDGSQFHRCDWCRQKVRHGQEMEHRQFDCRAAGRGGEWDSRLGHILTGEAVTAAADNQPYVCGTCGKPFTSATLLHSHERKVHNNVTCIVCGKKLRATGLTQHMRGHHTTVCYKCGKVCNSRTIKAHLRAHANKEEGRSFICVECGLKLKDDRQLRFHLRRKHKGKPMKSYRYRNYLCQVCGKAFSSTHLLATHMRIHTGERPYTCNICFKSFTQEQSLWRHRTVHSLERPYRCDVCDMGFSQSSGLTGHRNSERHKAKVRESAVNSAELKEPHPDGQNGGENAAGSPVTAAPAVHVRSQH